MVISSVAILGVCQEQEEEDDDDEEEDITLGQVWV